MDQALAVGIGRVDSETIDQINIKQAARLAMKLATEALDPQPEYILVDAEEIKTAIPQLAVIKGDQRSQSVHRGCFDCCESDERPSLLGVGQALPGIWNFPA